MSDDFPVGTVWLVGAGPGDPELLTRKAARLIGEASVVFHDALVGPGVLDLISPGAQLVHVGKRSGRHSKDQASIDRLIVEAALAGERVVRLKGGDPAIFGRVAEELDACRAAGIDARICPGVTAASAAAASLGASLTLRGLARKLTFITAHARAGEALDLDWAALADRQATLAIYMGKAAAPEVAEQLIAAGLPGDTPVAMVENASLPHERVLRTRLDLLGLAARSGLGDGPALLLIGQAMARAEISAGQVENPNSSRQQNVKLASRMIVPAITGRPRPDERFSEHHS
ncbi:MULTISPECIES: uroporphyrinogen-III C-methyltransferase [unclassified Novosphingobium]|uniref:uroporphyrinogen-III C-methyltransferase n=1 Tax=unclassified Novosphingobium TaxID=2644732 RepID=UPI00146CAAD5|nr:MULTISPECIES: uroporphyrinogen-III C-methyltransferase [unclassified Novosphingobium]NMN05321.1 uroporphyrin-III C-methyltransferase [Novosphingobium sp. SG919]NMN87616.1 uroporphyrin-III C-methyltransferase [Novosphingobium sp. SG916]